MDFYGFFLILTKPPSLSLFSPSDATRGLTGSMSCGAQRRFSYVQKRVIPIITVGIGSWALILNFLAFLGVTSTSFIAPWRKLLEAAGSCRKLLEAGRLPIHKNCCRYVFILKHMYMYAQRLGFAPALQRRGFPFPIFPIKCCCNFTFNWKDQQRY